VPRGIANDLADYDGQDLTRAALGSVIEVAYPEPRQPTSFGWRYSAPEELKHIDNRIQNATEDVQKRIVKAGEKRIQRHFLDGTDVRMDSDDLKRATDAMDWQVLDDLQWYRGDSIQALVYDQIEDVVRTYDLFYLLRYGDIEFVERDEFERIVSAKYDEKVARNARYVDGFCIYNGTIETTDEGWGRSVAFTGPRLNDWLEDKPIDSDRTPRVLDGIKLTVSRDGNDLPRVPSLSVLNDRLQSRRERTPGTGGGLLCYPVSMRPTVAKERYDLNEFFFLYQITLQGESAASLALGTDALYLHCHVMEEDNEPSTDDNGLIGL
jgi:CRISPR-associated endonuclease/helicase Cas3